MRDGGATCFILKSEKLSIYVILKGTFVQLVIDTAVSQTPNSRFP